MTFREISREITGTKPPLRTLARSRVVDPCSWVVTNLSGLMGLHAPINPSTNHQPQQPSHGSASMRLAPRLQRGGVKP